VPKITTLKKRADFLLAAKSGFRFVKPAIIVQSRIRLITDISPSPIRVGFTVTKKLGNAIIRNRAKRRMREASAKITPEFGLDGCDYVLIGREQAYKGSFINLLRDLRHAMRVLKEQMEATIAAKAI